MKRLVSRVSELPDISVCHEKNTSFPVTIAPSVSAKRRIGTAISASFASPSSMPSRAVERLVITPRRLGSVATGPKNGWAWMSCAVIVSTSDSGKKSNPLWSKKEPPSGWRTERNSPTSRLNSAESSPALLAAISGVAPSTTTTIRSVRFGNAFSKSALFSRHGRSAEIKSRLSVVMAKCCST